MPIVHNPTIAEPDDRDVLWRYIDFPAFVSMMLNGRLRFSRMDTFSDRWEGVLRRVEERALRSANTPTVVGRTRSVTGDLGTPERRQALALCWCRSEYENAMFWERYRADGLAVAIMTNACRLRSLLDASSWDVWFGSVRYVDIRGFDPTPNEVPGRLFLKDRSYASENEVRVVRHTADRDAPQEGEFMDIPVSTGSFLLKVFVHPLAPRWFGPLVKEVMERCGYAYDIEQSTLGGPLSGHSIEI